jgi:hypothetical protein
VPADYLSLTMVCHRLLRCPRVLIEGDGMIESSETPNCVATSSITTAGAVAPSCYRVSVVSGSLEVSARLKNVADLELLLRVLGANRVLFANEDQSLETAATMQAVPKANRPMRKTSKAKTIKARSVCTHAPIRSRDFDFDLVLLGEIMQASRRRTPILIRPQ